MVFFFRFLIGFLCIIFVACACDLLVRLMSHYLFLYGLDFFYFFFYINLFMIKLLHLCEEKWVLKIFSYKRLNWACLRAVDNERRGIGIV